MTYLTAFGETKTGLEWARDRRCVVTLRTLLERINSGWDHETALTDFSSSGADRYRFLVKAFGEEKPLGEWQKDPRMLTNMKTFLDRLSKGWDPEEALGVPEEDGPEREARRLKIRHMREAKRFALRGKPGLSRPRGTKAITSIEEALDFLDRGGEIWKCEGEAGGSRLSIILVNRRYEIDPGLLDRLTANGYVVKSFDTMSMQMYQSAKTLSREPLADR